MASVELSSTAQRVGCVVAFPVSRLRVAHVHADAAVGRVHAAAAEQRERVVLGRHVGAARDGERGVVRNACVREVFARGAYKQRISTKRSMKRSTPWLSNKQHSEK